MPVMAPLYGRVSQTQLNSQPKFNVEMKNNCQLTRHLLNILKIHLNKKKKEIGFLAVVVPLI